MFRSNHCLRRREYTVSDCLIWCDIVSCFKGAQNFSRGCTVQLLFMNCEYSALHCSFPVLNKRPNLYSITCSWTHSLYYIKRLLRLKYKIDYYIKKEKLPSTVQYIYANTETWSIHYIFNITNLNNTFMNPVFYGFSFTVCRKNIYTKYWPVPPLFQLTHNRDLTVKRKT